MKKLRLSDATASLADYTRELSQGPLIVTVRGKPIAALVPIEGVDMETLCVGTSPQFLDLIECSRRRQEAGNGYTSEELRREFGIPTVPPDLKPKAMSGKRNAARGKPKISRSVEK